MKNIIVVVVILAIVGLGFYYLMRPKAASAPSIPTSNTPSTSSDSGTPITLNVEINIKNFSFNPSTLNIKKGTKITWTNDDNTTHTVTSLSGTGPSSGNLNQGGIYSYTFDAVGTFKYKCGFHPSMLGIVVVTE